jgi:hypothetical protein
MLMWQIYLCGALVIAAGASVVADLFSDPDVPLTTRAAAIVFAGIAWPVLLVGLLQLICIRGASKILRSLAPRHFSGLDGPFLPTQGNGRRR